MGLKGKINARMLLIGILSMVLTGALTFTVFHHAFVNQVKENVRQIATTVVSAYELSGTAEAIVQSEEIRVTLISPQGEILYESTGNQSTMESHVERAEVLSALETGVGEAVRESQTLGYDTYYYAKKASDGNVLRIAMDAQKIYTNYNQVFPMMAVLGIIIMTISIVLSRVLTKKLVEPIETMAEHLDTIDRDVPYKELESFALAVKKQQIKKAEIAKMRQEFTANVSHELKTPLTSISGYAEMLVSGMVKDEDIKTFAEKIHMETGRLIELIGDILNLSELDDPEAQKKLESVDLYEVALNTAEMLSLKAEKNNVTILVEGEPAIIHGNRIMLEELVYNLCDNAIRYNKKNGMATMQVFNYVDKVVFSVIDTGIGIAKEHHERIFERFYRVDKSRSKATGGTGLGLAIVKHIVMQHGGKISIESSQGEGTVMKITFKEAEERLP